MRIVCLVPSITETLIFCNVDVVGRSKFCIHPGSITEEITAVGGTKNIDWGALYRLNPDLIVLDKEENTREMADLCPFPYIALHITSVGDVSSELSRLAVCINSQSLQTIALRWKIISQREIQSCKLEELPGVLDWWVLPHTGQIHLEYLIWKNPYMSIGPNTFIHSMLCHQGAENCLTSDGEKYPVIDLSLVNREKAVLLFSTEPFPFQRYREELSSLGFSCGLIDGEKYSWYGIRSLLFLEQGV